MKQKTRRYRVGSYWVHKYGNEIVVEARRGLRMDSFNSTVINQIKDFLALDKEAERAKIQAKLEKKSLQIAALFELTDGLDFELRTLRVDRDSVEGKYFNDYYVSGDETEVNIGCTKISRKKFNQLARLVE